MAALVGLAYLFGSCVAYKLHKCAALRAYTVATKNYKKLLFGALSLMAVSLFAISGDVHYSKSSTSGSADPPQYPPPTDGEHLAHSALSLVRKKATAVALLCIFMVIYAVGVRHPVAVLEDRLIGSRTNGVGTLMYKAISTTTHWLVVPLLIHLFLLNWGHIGFGWILVICAIVCLLTIIYVAVFIPDEVTDDTVRGDNYDISVTEEERGEETGV